MLNSITSTLFAVICLLTKDYSKMFLHKVVKYSFDFNSQARQNVRYWELTHQKRAKLVILLFTNWIQRVTFTPFPWQYSKMLPAILVLYRLFLIIKSRKYSTVLFILELPHIIWIAFALPCPAEYFFFCYVYIQLG